MSSTRCEVFNWMLVPTSLFIVLSVLTKSAFIELTLTYFLSILTLVTHIHYGTVVVSLFFCEI